MNATHMAADADHLDDACCADLVLGLLPTDEREAALAHAMTCPACEARMRAHVSAGERARADARARGARVVSPAWGWLPARRGMLAAAALLVVAAAVPFLASRPLDREPAHWLPDLGEPMRTREGESEDAHLTRGLEAYRAHQLETADRELSLARAEGAGEQLRLLYLANVRDRLGKQRSALALLRDLDWRELPEPWRHDGVVLLAHVLRANGETTSADSIEHALRSLPPGTPFVP
jgi:hypothetical protein